MHIVHTHEIWVVPTLEVRREEPGGGRAFAKALIGPAVVMGRAQRVDISNFRNQSEGVQRIQ